MQSSFEIVSANLFKHLPQKLSIGLVLEVKEGEHYRAYNQLNNYCIVPPQFELYIELVTLINTYDSSIKSQEDRNKFSIKDYLKTNLSDIPLMPFFDTVTEMQFAEMEAVNIENGTTIQFTITSVYNSQELMQYWLPKNTYDNAYAMQNLGLGNGIYNLVPPNHHYFDMSWICGCGVTECYNYIAWYIKYNNSYTVGFVIERYSSLELNSQNEFYNDHNYVEDLDEYKKMLAHNAAVEKIEATLSAATYDYDCLSEAEKLLLAEGLLTEEFSYLFELEGAYLYKPLLNSNEQLNSWIPYQTCKD